MIMIIKYTVNEKLNHYYLYLIIIVCFVTLLPNYPFAKLANII